MRSPARLIWKTNLGTPPAEYLWASPVLFNGSIYYGIASFGDCPLVQGQVVQMNATTGAIQHIADLAPNGCIGAGVWTSPTVDPSDGSIYVTTGTPNACPNPGPNLAPSIVKLRASDLTILSSWTVPTSEQQFGDEDFGATPTLFTATINGVPRSLVGAENKNGLFYVWDSIEPRGRPGVAVDHRRPQREPALDRVGHMGRDVPLHGRRRRQHQRHELLRQHQRARPCNGRVRMAVVPDELHERRDHRGARPPHRRRRAPAEASCSSTPRMARPVLNYNAKSMVQGEVTVSNGIVYVPLANGNLIALGQ